MNEKTKRLATPVISLCLFAVAAVLLNRALSDLKWDDLWRTLAEFPRRWVFLAIGLSALSYVALACQDYIGVRYIKKPIPFRNVLLTAFCAYAISHSLGFAAVTGGTVRYRMFERWHVSAVEVAQIMGMAAICMFLGMFEIGGLAMLLDGHRVQEWSDLPSISINLLGVLFLAIVVGYGALGFIRQEPLRLWRFQLAVPTPRFAAVQIAISGFDWLLVASVLYTLLPPNDMFTFPTFLGIFVVAYLAGVVSNVPAGLGVFESVIFYSLHHSVPNEAIVSSLLVYRAVYDLLPLAIGGTIFFLGEILRNKSAVGGAAGRRQRREQRENPLHRIGHHSA
jgi:uncharacterized membrane protein YbhN (UPF0104 family)